MFLDHTRNSICEVIDKDPAKFNFQNCCIPALAEKYGITNAQGELISCKHKDGSECRKDKWHSQAAKVYKENPAVKAVPKPTKKAKKGASSSSTATTTNNDTEAATAEAGAAATA